MLLNHESFFTLKMQNMLQSYDNVIEKQKER